MRAATNGKTTASRKRNELWPDPRGQRHEIAAVESKQLYCRGVTGCRREPAVTCHQSSSEFFSKHDIGRIIRGQIVAEPPNPGQQKEVGIPGDSQVEQVLDGLISAVG